MTRRAWFARLVALLPFCATRFSGPVALGSLKVGERFRFAGTKPAWIAGNRLVSAARFIALDVNDPYAWATAEIATLVYRVR